MLKIILKNETRVFWKKEDTMLMNMMEKYYVYIKCTN